MPARNQLKISITTSAESSSRIRLPTGLTACDTLPHRLFLPSPAPLTGCVRECPKQENRPDQHTTIPFGHPLKPKTNNISETNCIMPCPAKRNLRLARGGKKRDTKNRKGRKKRNRAQPRSNAPLCIIQNASFIAFHRLIASLS